MVGCATCNPAFFGNFRLGGRLLSFEFKNPWRLFLDFPSNSNHLGAAPAGSFFTSPAAKAAGFFQKPDTVIRMSCFWNKVRTFAIETPDCAEMSIPSRAQKAIPEIEAEEVKPAKGNARKL